MSMPYWKREKYIKELFDYEESHDVPEKDRLTYNPYEGMDLEASPRKKAYVDIYTVKGELENLDYMGKLDR